MGGKKTNRIRDFLKRRFKSVQTWQLIVILIPLLFFTATLLRLDHLKMVELRSAVLTADQEVKSKSSRPSLHYVITSILIPSSTSLRIMVFNKSLSVPALFILSSNISVPPMLLSRLLAQS